MASMNPLFAGMGLAFGVLFIQAFADVAVSYIPFNGQHRTLQGWIAVNTGL